MTTILQEVIQKALKDYEATLTSDELIKHREGIAKNKALEANRTILDKWMSVNKLMGESMPIITEYLYDEMRPQDLERLERKVDIVQLYRAMSIREYKATKKHREVFGQSWTFNPKVANFFLTHGEHSHGKVVVKIKVLKSDILAYIDDRDEKEAILRLGKIKMGGVNRFSFAG